MMVLTPAYGRDYKTATEVQTDWDAGKDFIIADIVHPYSGKPANKRDLASEVKSVEIRYAKLAKLTICTT